MSLSIAGEARLRVFPLVLDGPPLELGRSAMEQRWTAEALKPHALQLEQPQADPASERIGDLVELVVWSGAEAVAAWARASLAPQFSLQVFNGDGGG